MSKSTHKRYSAAYEYVTISSKSMTKRQLARVMVRPGIICTELVPYSTSSNQQINENCLHKTELKDNRYRVEGIE